MTTPTTSPAASSAHMEPLPTDRRAALLPRLPSHLPNAGGQILAAIPTHLPTGATDPAEWIVLARRDDIHAAHRAYSTNRLQRLGDDVLATIGHYDLTYSEALADLCARAGLHDGTDCRCQVCGAEAGESCRPGCSEAIDDEGCPACNAEPGEPCRPGCIGQAARDDELDDEPDTDCHCGHPDCGAC